LLTVGIPTVALAAWAKPGRPQKRELIGALLHFVLPAAISISLVALLVYLATILSLTTGMSDAFPPLSDALVLGEAQAIAQTALTTISIVCGLLLLPFVQPPIRFFTGGDELSSDWRPTTLAGVLLAVYAIILTVPPLRELFDLSVLSTID